MRRLALLAVLVAGCAGRYPTPAARAATPSKPAGVLALPYSIIDRDGHAVAEADFWNALGAARVVCVGEDHPNPHHHWAQQTIVERLAAAKKQDFGLGMEMVQRPFQAVLDDYAAGKIDEAAMRSRVGWDDRWGFEFDLYRPVIAAAVAHGASLIALNAAVELTDKVVHGGVESLTAAERAGIAKDLVLDDAQHRAWFDATMESMGGAAAHGGSDHAMPSADRIYSVQVIWDETMAETAAQWVSQGDRAMVVLAGNGHCHDSAIVRRIQRRGVTPVVSVQPVLDDGEGDVAQAIQEHRNDYLFVMEPPAH